MSDLEAQLDAAIVEAQTACMMWIERYRQLFGNEGFAAGKARRPIRAAIDRYGDLRAVRRALAESRYWSPTRDIAYPPGSHIGQIEAEAARLLEG